MKPMMMSMAAATMIGLLTTLTAAAQAPAIDTFQGPTFTYRLINQGTPQEMAVCTTSGQITIPEDAFIATATAQAPTVPAPGVGAVGLLGLATLTVSRPRRRTN